MAETLVAEPPVENSVRAPAARSDTADLAALTARTIHRLQTRAANQEDSADESRLGETAIRFRSEARSRRFASSNN